MNSNFGFKINFDFVNDTLNSSLSTQIDYSLTQYCLVSNITMEKTIRGKYFKSIIYHKI